METSNFDKSSLKNPKRKIQNTPSQPLHPRFHHRPVARSGSIRDQNFAPTVLSPAAAGALIQQLEILHGQKNGGVFLNPGPPFSLSSSLPPNYRQHQHQQPPLLPLPVVSKPAFLSLPPPPPPGPVINRQLSVSPPAHSRKQSHSIKTRKQQQQQQQQKAAAKKDDVAVKVANKKKPSGPDPGSLPKEVTTRIFLTDHTNDDDIVQKMTSAGSNYSVYSLSAPPPSSLPLPKFSLLRQHMKPQQARLISCTAEAAAAGEIDDGATDNLCRLLRLR